MTTTTVLTDHRRAPSRPSKASLRGRLTALARAELILLLRNRAAIFVALFVPV